jgi:hypothetical protein
MSQSKDEIVRSLPAGFSIIDFKISGDFVLATVSFPDDEGDGSWLGQLQPDGWKELCLTGGAFGDEDMDEFEVPQELRAGLLACYQI